MLLPALGPVWLWTSTYAPSALGSQPATACQFWTGSTFLEEKVPTSFIFLHTVVEPHTGTWGLLIHTRHRCSFTLPLTWVYMLSPSQLLSCICFGLSRTHIYTFSAFRRICCHGLLWICWLATLSCYRVLDFAGDFLKYCIFQTISGSFFS